jgi:hypothetical protein
LIAFLDRSPHDTTVVFGSVLVKASLDGGDNFLAGLADRP